MIKEIKERAKAAYKRNYWPSVFAAFLMQSGTLVAGSTVYNKASNPSTNGGVSPANIVSGLSNDQLAALVLVLMSVVSTALVLSALYDVFFGNIFGVGGKIFFLKSSNDENTNVKEVMAGFDKGYYMNNVKTMFLSKLFVALWSLLFIIPGIIKSFSYMLVPYIITDDPSIGGRDAITLSSRMMKGWKWKAFVLRLSFIGWDILNAFTFNLLNTFMIAPYKDAAEAELYREIKQSLQDAQAAEPEA